jgi:hypothetical protein
MLLFRGNDWDKKLSPEALQGTMSKWTACPGFLGMQSGDASRTGAQKKKNVNAGCPPAGSFIRRPIVKGTEQGTPSQLKESSKNLIGQTTRTKNDYEYTSERRRIHVVVSWE